MKIIAIEIEIDAEVVVNFTENQNTNNRQHCAVIDDRLFIYFF
jgi:hypothetical protein